MCETDRERERVRVAQEEVANHTGTECSTEWWNGGELHHLAHGQPHTHAHTGTHSANVLRYNKLAHQIPIKYSGFSSECGEQRRPFANLKVIIS